MERYNQCGISAFGIILSIIGGLFILLAINTLFGIEAAEAPIFLIGLIWTACAGILAFICEQLGI